MYAVIATKLPRRTAQEAVLTGRRYGAPEAMAAGIAHRAASEEQVLADAVLLAKALAGKDRRALTAHKKLLYGEAIRVCGSGVPGHAGE
jgi:enoyl-CoA hydratase/carnithine racemase